MNRFPWLRSAGIVAGLSFLDSIPQGYYFSGYWFYILAVVEKRSAAEIGGFLFWASIVTQVVGVLLMFLSIFILFKFGSGMPFELSRFVILGILFSLSASAGSIAGSLTGFGVLLLQYPNTNDVSGLIPELIWPRYANWVLFGSIIGILARTASDLSSHIRRGEVHSDMAAPQPEKVV